MPFPHDELLREFPSPVPTQTIFGLFCETATEPVDATASLSKTPCHVVPLLVVRRTPPVPTAAKIVYGSFSFTAKSAMRPPMFAGPTERHFSGLVSSGDGAGAIAAAGAGALVTLVAVAWLPSAGSRGGGGVCCGCWATAVVAARTRQARNCSFIVRSTSNGRRFYMAVRLRTCLSLSTESAPATTVARTSPRAT